MTDRSDLTTLAAELGLVQEPGINLPGNDARALEEFRHNARGLNVPVTQEVPQRTDPAGRGYTGAREEPGMNEDSRAARWAAAAAQSK